MNISSHPNPSSPSPQTNTWRNGVGNIPSPPPPHHSLEALGRVASSLYVVTAKKANVRHAMVASWVTPASAKPLGVSVTIAKERAMAPPMENAGDGWGGGCQKPEMVDVDMDMNMCSSFAWAPPNPQGHSATVSPGGQI